MASLSSWFESIRVLTGRKIYNFKQLVQLCSKKELFEIARITPRDICGIITFRSTIRPHSPGFDVFAASFVMYNTEGVYDSDVSSVSEYLGAPLNLRGGMYITNMMKGNYGKITFSLRKRLIAFLYGCKKRYGYYRDLRHLFCRVIVMMEVDYMYFKATCKTHESTVHVLKQGYHSLDFIDLVEKPMSNRELYYWAFPWFRWRRGGPKRLQCGIITDYSQTLFLISLGEYGLYLNRVHGLKFNAHDVRLNPNYAIFDPQACSDLIKANVNSDSLSLYARFLIN